MEGFVGDSSYLCTEIQDYNDMKKILLAALAAVCTLTSHADEGMWMLNNISPQTAQTMKNLGLKLTPQELYNPDGVSLKDAVVDFGDFCSGVVVSKDGLVFTNHHCGFGAIQALSSPEDDILKNGFVAHNHAEERPAEGLFVRFLQRTEECSSRIMKDLAKLYSEHSDMHPKDVEQRYADSICNAVEKEYRAANPGLDCQVKKYYGGNAYFVSFYKVYTDIRLVFTATQTLGKFGGDTDNWMWPRQTSDFSVFRIYADKNGEPAPYSADNVPLHPKRYAKVCLDGFRQGDYCMTIGYPGSTNRYLSSWGISERVNQQNVSTIQVRGKKQEVWKRFMDADRAVAIKYASKWARSSNYWKNSIGMNKAIADLDVIGQKQQTEAKIKAWYEADESLNARFGDVFQSLQRSYAQRRKAVHANGFYRETFLSGIEVVSPARMLNMLPTDADSTERASAQERLQAFFKDYDARLDEATTAALLQNYRQQVTDSTFWPACYKTIDQQFGGDCEAYARDLFSRTICTSPLAIDMLMADSTLREKDPALLLADDVMTSVQHMFGSMRDASVNIRYGERLLTQALLEMDQETPHYSDANFTMRLSYGIIQDYTAQGTHYNYFTNAQSLLDKAAQQDKIEDYALEDDIVSLISQRRFGRYADRQTKDLHLCFLSTNDITGGNSGSPMFNGKGELIGLAFDGNWEAMSGDISFDPSLQRCIGVDIRFVLFLMDKWGHANNLIRELGI